MRSLERSRGSGWRGLSALGQTGCRARVEGRLPPAPPSPPTPCPSAGSARVWQSRGAAAPDLPASAASCHSSPPAPTTAVVQKCPTGELASARGPRRLWASDAGAGAPRQVTGVWSWALDSRGDGKRRVRRGLQGKGCWLTALAAVSACRVPRRDALCL